MDINSTFAPFSLTVCLNGVYVGMTLSDVVVFLCFVLGTPVHFWYLWFVHRSGWKIKPTQVFPLILTVLDLMYSIKCAVEIFVILISRNIAFWKVSIMTFGLCCVGRCLMQVCICVEQYLAVIHPIMFLKYKGLRYRIVCAAGSWLMATAYAVFQTFTDHFPNPIFNSIFFIAVIVISFCCVSVLRALKDPGPGDTQTPVGRGRDLVNQQKRNAFNTIFTGLLIILFTYLPQVSLGLFNLIQTDENLLYCDIVPIINNFTNLGVMITPFLKMYKMCPIKCFKHKRVIKLNR